MENRVKKIRILILSVVVTIALVIGYETFRLVSVLKEKRELTARIVELSEEKASLESSLLQNNLLLKAAKGSLKSLKKKLSRLQYFLREKTLQEAELQKQLSLTQVKLEALNLANNFLEKEIETLNISKKSFEDELNKIREEPLTQKEAKVYFKKNISSLKQALVEKEKESLALKKELAGRTQEKDALQSQLQAINRIITLNASSPQGLTGFPQSATQEEENRKKASDLKHKIEVTLMPQENKE